MDILIDTNVVVALVDRTDDDHRDHQARLATLDRHTLVVPTAVLVEACHFLRRPDQRALLEAFLVAYDCRTTPEVETFGFRDDLYRWLARFADQRPDLVDGLLCVLHRRTPRSVIWTTDSEFSTVWRTLDGKPIRLLR